ncbi:PAS domain-containing sensor histidine kinase [Glaciihabitans sp. dw_435]|uniref:PAS domain-containing sensor histidine kinase n=1 Tax=Glaciihabitans sp. dw_435 TaxID=2720081 RepID=UPI001BD4D283|nr:PAS domain-containing sensor histidine kinase [Glaciihabitans sp. dw_435]
MSPATPHVSKFWVAHRASLLLYVQVPMIGSIAIVITIATATSSARAVSDAFVAAVVLLAVSVIALMVGWRVNHNWLILVAVADILVITFLRGALTGEQPGLSVLVLIPMLWLSYSFGVWALFLGLVSPFFVALFPFIVGGGWPDSPTDWGNATLLPAILNVVALAVFAAARQQRRDRTALTVSNELLRISEAQGLDTTATTLAVVDTVDAGITYYNTQGEILISNAAAQSAAGTGGSPSLTNLAPWSMVFEADRVTPVPREDQTVARAARGELTTRHLYWIGEAADQRAMLVTSRFVRRASGEIIGTVVASSDVTSLAEAIRARDQFLTTISHELRTPLTSMIGYLELIEDELDLTGLGVDREFAVVQRNSQRLLALITDLLMSAGEQALSLRIRVDLGATVRTALDAVRAGAAARGIRIIDPALPELHVEGDADLLASAFDKVLSNAVKFSRSGGTVSATGGIEGQDVVIRITDTGIGIAEADQPHIFERFYRAPSVRDDEIPGTGLGLSIVKTVVEAHRGTASVSSELGVGTVIEVRIPRPVASTGV